nr:hypothetical protein [uncultured Chryseobacterium sp.]
MKERLIVIVEMPDALTLDVVGPADVFTLANDSFYSENINLSYKVVIGSATIDLEVKIKSDIVIHTVNILYDIQSKIVTLLI